jgi:hypothetical protein
MATTTIKTRTRKQQSTVGDNWGSRIGEKTKFFELHENDELMMRHFGWHLFVGEVLWIKFLLGEAL